MDEHQTSDSTTQRKIASLEWPDAPLTKEQISAIHDASLEVLSKTGFRFACERVQEIFKKNGFRVEGERVYFTEKEILRALETIPKSFTIRSRNPRHDIIMEQGTVSFELGRGAVHIVELDGSYRTARKDDFIDSLKLCQSMDAL
jgi:trimethylamine--corrinoid protein Co-methyltransferase